MDIQKQSNYIKIKCPTHILIVFYFLECFYFPKLFYEQMIMEEVSVKVCSVCKNSIIIHSNFFFISDWLKSPHNSS